jgi:hypothetical protein
MGTSPKSPKMSGISSFSRSYRQITQIRRPAGVAANTREISVHLNSQLMVLQQCTALFG